MTATASGDRPAQLALAIARPLALRRAARAARFDLYLAAQDLNFEMSPMHVHAATELQHSTQLQEGAPASASVQFHATDTRRSRSTSASTPLSASAAACDEREKLTLGTTAAAAGFGFS